MTQDPKPVTGPDRLKAALARLRSRPSPPPLSLDPSNPWEVAVAERLAAMQDDIDEIRARLNWLLTLIVGAAVANVVIALLQ